MYGKCPRCGSENITLLTETHSHTKGYGLGKGCLGYLILGPFGWLCGLCGMGEGRMTSQTVRVCANCGYRFR